MRTFDISPLYRSTVGFDRLFDLLDQTARVEPMTNWPPYNIEKTGRGPVPDHHGGGRLLPGRDRAHPARAATCW